MNGVQFIVGIGLMALPSIAMANADKDAVKAVIKAVRASEDLTALYPDAIDSREIASLARVAKCSALNLMKQKSGYYTVVWDCGAKGALGMQVAVEGGIVTAISTMEVGMRPNNAGRP